MENEKVFAMSFSKVYGLLIAKAERKGRTRAEVEEVIFWLTGYTAQQIEELLGWLQEAYEFSNRKSTTSTRTETRTSLAQELLLKVLSNPEMATLLTILSRQFPVDKDDENRNSPLGAKNNDCTHLEIVSIWTRNMAWASTSYYQYIFREL